MKYSDAALRYYRMEWGCPEEILIYKKEVNQILAHCKKCGENIPNAAKEIDIFMEVTKEKS
jgi:hypothetical protein